ncbi:MAG: hypothetical protein LBK26_02955 [Rickettsiales bacterium]|jgi:hypothetical protein|nr:hypothetical protein [Rickettsiales bacterium]
MIKILKKTTVYYIKPEKEKDKPALDMEKLRALLWLLYILISKKKDAKVVAMRQNAALRAIGWAAHQPAAVAAAEKKTAQKANAIGKDANSFQLSMAKLKENLARNQDQAKVAKPAALDKIKPLAQENTANRIKLSSDKMKTSIARNQPAVKIPDMVVSQTAPKSPAPTKSLVMAKGPAAPRNPNPMVMRLMSQQRSNVRAAA